MRSCRRETCKWSRIPDTTTYRSPTRFRSSPSTVRVNPNVSVLRSRSRRSDPPSVPPYIRTPSEAVHRDGETDTFPQVSGVRRSPTLHLHPVIQFSVPFGVPDPPRNQSKKQRSLVDDWRGSAALRGTVTINKPRET